MAAASASHVSAGAHQRVAAESQSAASNSGGGAHHRGGIAKNETA